VVQCGFVSLQCVFFPFLGGFSPLGVWEG
jgi:hypothetical protein